MVLFQSCQIFNSIQHRTDSLQEKRGRNIWLVYQSKRLKILANTVHVIKFQPLVTLKPSMSFRDNFPTRTF